MMSLRWICIVARLRARFLDGSRFIDALTGELGSWRIILPLDSQNLQSMTAPQITDLPF